MLTSRTIRKYAATGMLSALSGGCHIDTADLGTSGAGQPASNTGGASQGSGGATSAAGSANSSGGASLAGGTTSVAAGGTTLLGAGGTTLLGAGGTPVLGTGGQPGACICPTEALSWGYSGGLAGPATQASLDCSGFRRTNPGFAPDYPAYECELPNIACYDNWHPELLQALALLQNADVRAALSAAPITYGLDRTPVDGVLFIIDVNGRAIRIGDDCAGVQSCVSPPAGVVAFVDALKKLERHAALDCSPECEPTPPSTSGESCAEPKYYWMYNHCTQVTGRSCDVGYDSAEACLAAHRQCSGLYSHACGGDLPSGSACADDEYCAYREYNDCGRADGSAICLPKPRACDAVGAPVCGCDNKTYGNLCEAAMAGVGQSDIGACR